MALNNTHIINNQTDLWILSLTKVKYKNLNKIRISYNNTGRVLLALLFYERKGFNLESPSLTR